MEAAKTLPGKAQRPNAKLRGRMKEYDVTAEYMARKIGITSRHYSKLLMGQRPWYSTQMYGVMEALDIPVEEMHIYFPDCRRTIR